MNIFGICLVKNEEDILLETLEKALLWCDKIYIYDTGSSDSTWEICRSLAEKKPDQIILYKHETRAFCDELRGEVFNHYRHLAKDGDWWCRLDADEIYIDQPKLFLAQIPRCCHVVFSLSHQYYFTEQELAEYNKNPQKFLSRPAEERLRHYICNHSEIRFFKHRKRLVWGQGSWPYHLGVVSHQRIRLKHLQYRSPGQIQTRLETRRKATEEGFRIFAKYDAENTWEEKVVQSKILHYDTGAGLYLSGDQKLPQHIEKPLHRAIKHVMHGARIWP